MVYVFLLNMLTKGPLKTLAYIYSPIKDENWRSEELQTIFITTALFCL